MSSKTYGVRRKYGPTGQFEVADVDKTTARQRAARLSQLSENTVYSVVDVNTDHEHAAFLNGKDVS